MRNIWLKKRYLFLALSIKSIVAKKRQERKLQGEREEKEHGARTRRKMMKKKHFFIATPCTLKHKFV